MKRIMWTVGMALAGFFVGMKGGPDIRVLVIATVWAGCIGFGFGSIFVSRRSEKRIVLYWAFTVALVGAFFAPLVPLKSLPFQVIVAGMIGALSGGVVGLVQFRFSRKRQADISRSLS